MQLSLLMSMEPHMHGAKASSVSKANQLTQSLEGSRSTRIIEYSQTYTRMKLQQYFMHPSELITFYQKEVPHKEVPISKFSEPVS
jgi:hypothetical protein